MYILDLIGRMLAFDPKKRITIHDIKRHKWFTNGILNNYILIKYLKIKHRKAEEKRKQDVKKMEDLRNSVEYYWHSEWDNMDCEFFPNKEGINTIYSYGDTYHWRHLYQFIEQHIREMNGDASWDDVGNKLECTLPVKGKGNVMFYIKIWRSKKWNGKKPIEASGLVKDKCVYIIEPRRVSDHYYFVYQDIKTEYILKKWSPWTMGLPKWALKIRKQNDPLSGANSIIKQYMDDVHNILEQYLWRYNVNYNLFLKPTFQILLMPIYV